MPGSPDCIGLYKQMPSLPKNVTLLKALVSHSNKYFTIAMNSSKNLENFNLKSCQNIAIKDFL